jgi:hypothetical protein
MRHSAACTPHKAEKLEHSTAAAANLLLAVLSRHFDLVGNVSLVANEQHKRLWARAQHLIVPKNALLERLFAGRVINENSSLHSVVVLLNDRAKPLVARTVQHIQRGLVRLVRLLLEEQLCADGWQVLVAERICRRPKQSSSAAQDLGQARQSVSNHQTTLCTTAHRAIKLDLPEPAEPSTSTFVRFVTKRLVIEAPARGGRYACEFECDWHCCQPAGTRSTRSRQANWTQTQAAATWTTTARSQRHFAAFQTDTAARSISHTRQ